MIVAATLTPLGPPFTPFSADGMVSLRESFVKLIGCSAMST